MSKAPAHVVVSGPLVRSGSRTTGIGYIEEKSGWDPVLALSRIFEKTKVARMDPKNAVRLLLVEDEQSLVRPLERGLKEEGYHVEVAADGESGLRLSLTGEFDLLLVDWRLPGIDGRVLIERLRAARVGTPTLMLTALQDVDHRIAGLNAGADDYLTKPFAFDELLARIRALLRRASRESVVDTVQKVHLEAGGLRMNTSRRTARHGSRQIELRTKEYRLLELLMRKEGEVVTRTHIADFVWGSPFEVTDNAIAVTVSNLRQRIAGAAQDGIADVEIETIRGVGYRLRAVHVDQAGGITSWHEAR